VGLVSIIFMTPDYLITLYLRVILGLYAFMSVSILFFSKTLRKTFTILNTKKSFIPFRNLSMLSFAKLISQCYK